MTDFVTDGRYPEGMDTDTPPALAFSDPDRPAANDNAWAFGPPTVHTPRRRPDAPYARSANVILPLRFAERMPGWRRNAGAPYMFGR